MARSWWTARSHAEPRPGRAPPVDDDDGEALVGEPLRGEVGVVRLHDARAVRTAVRVEQHGQRRAVVVVGEQHGGGQAALAAERQPDVGAHRRRGRVRAQLDAVQRLPLRARLGQRRRAHDDRAAAGGDGVHAGLVGQRLERAVDGPPPDLDRRGVVERVGREHDPRPVDGRHGADLEVGRRDRLAVDEQAAGAVAVGALDERAVGRDAGHAGHELDPDVVVVLGQQLAWRRWPGRPGGSRPPAGPGAAR